MTLNKRAPLITSLSYSLIASVVALSEVHTRIFDRGNSEMAGLATYLVTLPSSATVDVIMETAGSPIGSSDTAFMLYCGLSVLINSGLVFLVASASRRVLARS